MRLPVRPWEGENSALASGELEKMPF